MRVDVQVDRCRERSRAGLVHDRLDRGDHARPAHACRRRVARQRLESRQERGGQLPVAFQYRLIVGNRRCLRRGGDVRIRMVEQVGPARTDAVEAAPAIGLDLRPAMIDAAPRTLKSMRGFSGMVI